mmetsp:Transcript_20192/g.60335  ORF Transcript_20192/g.60335 Transcript_20192/m.60335 type:complete len:215 (-) Transcript_20192:17-661(-)
MSSISLALALFRSRMASCLAIFADAIWGIRKSGPIPAWRSSICCWIWMDSSMLPSFRQMPWRCLRLSILSLLFASTCRDVLSQLSISSWIMSANRLSSRAKARLCCSSRAASSAWVSWQASSKFDLNESFASSASICAVISFARLKSSSCSARALERRRRAFSACRWSVSCGRGSSMSPPGMAAEVTSACWTSSPSHFHRWTASRCTLLCGALP